MSARPWDRADDECDLRDGRCIRKDDAHHLELVPVPVLGGVEWQRGGCLHRHTVDTLDGGRVCRHCWARLPRLR